MSDCPTGFVDLEAAAPEIERVMAYGSPNNFTGAPLPGYHGTRAWLHESCIESLLSIASELGEMGFRLRLYDAYRPARAVAAMLDWARRVGKESLLEEGYLAPISRHSKGCAVDVTLVDTESGRELDMGTPWDAFDARSHSAWGEGLVRINRDRLRQPFLRWGWRAAQTEWWHFDRDREGLVPLDVPYT